MNTWTPGAAEAWPADAMTATAPMDPVAARAAKLIRHQREPNMYMSPFSQSPAFIGFALQTLQHEGVNVYKNQVNSAYFNASLPASGTWKASIQRVNDTRRNIRHVQ
jgi:hypothetical protein